LILPLLFFGKSPQTYFYWNEAKGKTPIYFGYGLKGFLYPSDDFMTDTIPRTYNNFKDLTHIKSSFFNHTTNIIYHQKSMHHLL